MVGKQEDNKNNKSLIAIFAALTAVIAALVVAIVVIVTTQPEPETPPVIAEEPDEPEPEPENDFNFIVDGDIYIEELAKYEYLKEDYNEIIAKAETLLQEKPVDIDNIKKLFMDKVQESLDMGTEAIATKFFYGLYTFILSDNGFKQEAVTTILNANLDEFSEVQKYKFYRDAKVIAEEINDQTLINEADAKMKLYQKAFDEQSPNNKEVTE